jgi:hypothetical protein
MRALNFLMIVFVQAEYSFKGFVAIVADVVVHGHGDPPAGNYGNFTPAESRLLIFDFCLLISEAALAAGICSCPEINDKQSNGSRRTADPSLGSR